MGKFKHPIHICGAVVLGVRSVVRRIGNVRSLTRAVRFSVVFYLLFTASPILASADRSVVKNAVGIQQQATVKTGKSSLKVSQTKAGSTKTSVVTKKIASQLSSQPAVLKSSQKNTATKIIPQKQFQKIIKTSTTKTSTAVSKTASPKAPLSKTQTAASKTMTAKSVAITSKKGTAASSKAAVQKSLVPSNIKSQASSSTSGTKVLLKSSQVVPLKQTALKVTPKQSVTQPKNTVPSTSGGVRALSPVLAAKSIPIFSLNTSVRLSDVAKQLRLQYSASGQSITLSNGNNRFEFQSGTKEAKFNGIKIFLSFPVEKQSVPTMQLKKQVHQLRSVSPEYLIRTADVENILKPLLFPKNFVKKRVKIIVIDPGHGGKADGTVQNGVKEKLLTLKTSQLLASKLEKLEKGYRYTVHLTRNKDTDVSLSQRSEDANNNHADLFISIHYNSAPSEQARGIEIFTFPLTGCPSSDHVVTKEFVPMPINAFDGQNSLLGWSVQEKIIRSIGSVDRGVKRKHLGVLRELNCPGILIECGFLSNPKEAKACNSADYQEKLTQAIANGIRAYNGG